MGRSPGGRICPALPSKTCRIKNDGAILSIAYDNVHYRAAPEAWNMRLVLGISTVLGVIGVVSAFGLFYLGERVFHIDRAHIQTMMYLKLSVAGHQTRTRRARRLDSGKNRLNSTSGCTMLPRARTHWLDPF
jgi:hypothetical protein